jgi:uncharacterized peroxidase-related enzyme
MTKIQVPTREQVSSGNQEIFDNLKAKLGFVPNIYATYALSDHALGRFMTFSSGKTTLTAKQKEVVNLVVSQINGCTYCQAAHTAIGKMNGFTDEQIISIRKGDASFDPKLHAIALLAIEIIQNGGKVDEQSVERFLEAGFSNENLVDLILAVGEKAITNYLHNVTKIPIDFPEAPVIESTLNR